MIEQGIIRLINGDPVPGDTGRATAQAALVAALAGDCFPGKAPQDVLPPYAVVAKAGAEHVKYTKGRAGACASRVRLEFYHPLYATAEGLADLARILLDGYSGPLDGGFTAMGVFQEDDDNDWQGPHHADEQGSIAATLTLKIWHTES